MQELLPALRPDRKAEHRVIGPALQAIAPGVLLVRPALWQVGGRFDVVIDDGPVAYCWP